MVIGYIVQPRILFITEKYSVHIRFNPVNNFENSAVFALLPLLFTEANGSRDSIYIR